jgi:hypothetical protein
MLCSEPHTDILIKIIIIKRVTKCKYIKILHFYRLKSGHSKPLILNFHERSMTFMNINHEL